MTPEIVAQLHPPRLPASVVATQWTDLCTAVGLGLLIAALVAAVAGPLLRPRPRRESVAARLARAGALPPDRRLVAQLALLRESGTPLPADLRTALYTAAPPDPEVLDALVLSGRHA